MATGALPTARTGLAPWMQQSAGAVDPWDNAYFGTKDRYGEATSSLGSGDGRGYYSGIPDEVYDIRDEDGHKVQGPVNLDRLRQWLGSNQIMEANRPGTSARWLQDPSGNVIGPVDEISTDDSKFMTAAALAAAVTGANVMGAAGAAAPAATGPAPLNMAMIESGLGTAGYGYNAGAAASGLFNPATIGAGAGSMFGTGGSVVPYSADAVTAMTAPGSVGPQLPGGIKTLPSSMPQAPAQQPALPTGTTPPITMPVLPPLPAVGGGLLGTIGNAASTAGNYLADNPQLIGAIGGAVLPLLDGGSDGGEAPYSGPMPTITRGDWKPRQQANYMQVPQFGQGFLANQQPTNNNAGLWRYGAQSGLLGGAPAMPTGLLAPVQQPSTTGSNTSYTPQEIRDYASAQGWFTNDGLMVPGSERKIYDAAQQFGVGGNQLDQAFNWGSGTADNYVSGQNWAALSGQR